MDNSITASLETITPEQAARVLDECNQRNRALTSTHVKKLAEDIKQGLWCVNGETICFDNEGMLADGQHRLNAIVLADRAVQTIVVRGLDKEAFATIDIGRRRTAADALSVKHVTHPQETSIALRMLHSSHYLSGDWDGRVATTAAFSNARALQLHAQHPDVVDAVNRMMLPDRKHCRELLFPGLACFIYYAFAQINKDDAELFFQWLEYGENMERTNPVMQLREKIVSMRMQDRDRGAAFKRKLTGLSFKAWNMVRGGSGDTLLRWSSHRFPTLN